MDSTNYGNRVRQLTHVCDGTTAIVGGYVKKDARGFTIDLRTSPNRGHFDVALHVNVRYHQCTGIVVRNSFTNGKWDSEESDGSPISVKPGETVECILLITNHLIKVAFNGLHYCDFRHRMPKENIQEVAVSGDIDVANLTFYGPGMTVDSYGGFDSCMIGSSQLSGFSQGHTTTISKPVKLHIPGALYAGRQIYVRGIPGSTRFVINLRYQIGQGNILFHFVAHMQKRVVIRNSFLHGSFGFEEINQPSFPFETGRPFDMIIRCEHDKIKVAVNHAHFIDFTHRDLNLTAVQCIEVLDDVSNVTVNMPV